MFIRQTKIKYIHLYLSINHRELVRLKNQLTKCKCTHSQMYKCKSMKEK